MRKDPINGAEIPTIPMLDRRVEARSLPKHMPASECYTGGNLFLLTSKFHLPPSMVLQKWSSYIPHFPAASSSHPASRTRCVTIHFLFTLRAFYFYHNLISAEMFTADPKRDPVTIRDMRTPSEPSPSSQRTGKPEKEPALITSTWGIGWQTPTLMITCYVLGNVNR